MWHKYKQESAHGKKPFVEITIKNQKSTTAITDHNTRFTVFKALFYYFMVTSHYVFQKNFEIFNPPIFFTH